MTAVLVTRPSDAADALVRALEQHGYRVYAVPTVQTEPSGSAIPDLSDCDWILVTSVQGVKALTVLPKGPRFAAVGAKTANALRERGVEPDHVPPQSNGAALADSLPDVSGKRIALVRASAAGGDLPSRLRQRGATVEEVTAYRTHEGPATSAEGLRRALADPDLAAVLFASGSAIRGFLALGGTIGLPAITIGPRTTATARDHGFRVLAEANDQSAESLAAAVSTAVPAERDA